MPQLNPSPWFITLVFSWFIFTVVIPPKIMSHAFPNNPDSQLAKARKMTPWTWQWR